MGPDCHWSSAFPCATPSTEATATAPGPAAAVCVLVTPPRVSYPWMGPDCHWSSAFPCGTPSTTSTITTVRARSFSARRWAALAPTLPAPTTVIRLSMERLSVGGSDPADPGGEAPESTWRRGEGQETGGGAILASDAAPRGKRG